MNRNRWVFRFCALAFLSCLAFFFNAEIHRVPAVFRFLSAWPALVAVLLWSVPEDPGPLRSRLVRWSALLSVLWTLVWALLWMAALAFPVQPDVALIRRLGWINLAGIGAITAAFLWVLRDPRLAVRQAGFWAVIGGCVAYVSWVNLFLEPSWRFFTGPALGALLLVIAGWILRRMRMNDASL